MKCHAGDLPGATMVPVTCIVCTASFLRRPIDIERTRVTGMRGPFCSLKCSGFAHRTGVTREQKIARKAKYDAEYREKNLAKLKAGKAAHFQRTYDADQARIERKAHAAEHAAYIKLYYADPANKAEKVEYDKRRRASEYGPFADAYEILLLLQREILKQAPNRYERMKARGYYENYRTTKQRRRHAGYIGSVTGA